MNTVCVFVCDMSAEIEIIWYINIKVQFFISTSGIDGSKIYDNKLIWIQISSV